MYTSMMIFSLNYLPLNYCDFADNRYLCLSQVVSRSLQNTISSKHVITYKVLIPTDIARVKGKHVSQCITLLWVLEMLQKRPSVFITINPSINKCRWTHLGLYTANRIRGLFKPFQNWLFTAHLGCDVTNKGSRHFRGNHFASSITI